MPDYFKHLGNDPSPKQIFDYISAIDDVTVINEGIELLGNLGYNHATPFIQNRLDSAQRWYQKYALYPHAKNKHVALESIRVSREALGKLEKLK